MRKPFAAGLALLTALLLAGCVGIPTSGGIASGPEFDEQEELGIVEIPNGPRQGSTPEEIIADFMQAVRGTQNDYAVAREFMTDALANSWRPDERALIRTGNAALTPAGDGVYNYGVSSRAFVDSQGRYVEQRDTTSSTLEFSVVEVDGEYRINEAADGIVLSQTSFDRAFTQQALYFFDPTFRYLVPDLRWLPARVTTPRRAVNALLQGPSPWLSQSVITQFPLSTAARSVTTQSGTATVDLTEAASAASPEAREGMRQQLLATLASANVSNVVMTVNNVPLTSPDSTSSALIDPPVAGSLVAGTADEFGFLSGTGIAPIAGLSDAVVEAGATAGTAGHGAVAFLGAGGDLYIADSPDEPARLLDATRPDLTVPALDAQRFVWSMSASDVTSLTAWEFDGTPHSVEVPLLPANTSVVSMDLSRDGARLLLYVSTDAGPRLLVAGVVRTDGIPISLGAFESLPVGAATPVDATWVDDRTVAVVAETASNSPVTVFEIGGPSVSLSQVSGAVSIVGGNNGTDGIRLLSSSGGVWQPSGGGGWADTGLSASFLATQH